MTGMGGVMWQRTALPTGGSVGEQDAWVLAALDYTRDVHNAMAFEALDRARSRQKRTTKGRRG